MLMSIMDIPVRIIVFVAGFSLVYWTVMSAIRSFVLPRADRPLLTSIVFLGMVRLFRLGIRDATSYEQRDKVMAFYAPVTLMFLPVVWLWLVMFGYTAMFWSEDKDLKWDEAFLLSGSSVLTLGFSFDHDPGSAILAFTEAILGLLLIALLIAYLPAMYAAFQRRETQITLLEVRAGAPPSAIEMILRLHRVKALYDEDQMREMWERWEIWFAELEESHTTLAPLIFFRSPKPHRSWVVASGTVLDAAAIVASSVDLSRNIQIGLTIRSGFVTLRSIGDFFSMPYNRNPRPEDPISVAKEEFLQAYDTLAEAGIPMHPDREKCWRDYSGWRVNYDEVLLALAALTYAPYAPWISDRSLPTFRQPTIKNMRNDPIP
jgi:hypothetical protein